MTAIGDVFHGGTTIPDDVVRMAGKDGVRQVELTLVVELGHGDVEYWIDGCGSQWGDEDIPTYLYPLTVKAVRRPPATPAHKEVAMATAYTTKDSGQRERFDSGMQRDTQAGKARFDLMLPLDVPYDEQLLTRYAMLLARGAEKYTERNWEQATGDAELGRAKASALRHLMQWMCGETDEDHAAAVMFNLTVVEYVRYRMRTEESIAVAFRNDEPATVDVTVHREAIEATGTPTIGSTVDDDRGDGSGYDSYRGYCGWCWGACRCDEDD